MSSKGPMRGLTKIAWEGDEIYELVKISKMNVKLLMNGIVFDFREYLLQETYAKH